MLQQTTAESGSDQEEGGGNSRRFCSASMKSNIVSAAPASNGKHITVQAGVQGLSATPTKQHETKTSRTFNYLNHIYNA